MTQPRRAEPIRWGILGAGRIAKNFCDALAQLPDARIAGIAARDGAKAAQFAKHYAAPLHVSSFEALCAAPEIDVVYIATPNTLHHDHALIALRAGKPVLMEKPFAMSAVEASAIFAEARQRNLFCMEALWSRFTPAIVEAKRLVTAGAIGDVTGFSGDLSFARPYAPGNRFFDADMGGGALLDLGVYPLSLAIHFMGHPLHVAATGRLAPSFVPFEASLALRFAGGTGTISCGFAAEGANEATITGTLGRIRLQRLLNAPAGLTLYKGGAARTSQSPDMSQILQAPAAPPGSGAGWRQILRGFDPRKARFIPRPYRGNGMGHQATEVMRCLRAGLTQSPVMDWADTLATAQALDEAAAQIAKTG
jgi:predicted dehydrogenase